MDGFLQRFESVDPESSPDDGFDLVIDLDITASSRENLETVITRLYNEYPKLFGDQEMPTSDDMDAAIEAAMNDYTVDIKHEIKGGNESSYLQRRMLWLKDMVCGGHTRPDCSLYSEGVLQKGRAD